jgi:hypothetical protein
VRHAAFVGAVVAVFSVGCGQPTNQGSLGAHCYPNGTCDVTLSCNGGVCIRADAAVAIDAPADAAIDAPADAAIDAPFPCNNDSAFEPNGTIQTAFQTPVAATQLSVVYASLAICPTTDVDVFKVNTTVTTQNLETLITYGTGDPLDASILNSGGVPIANAAANGANSLRAYVANLPVGSYYVRVATTAGENNYQLTINVTGP